MSRGRRICVGGLPRIVAVVRIILNVGIIGYPKLIAWFFVVIILARVDGLGAFRFLFTLISIYFHEYRGKSLTDILRFLYEVVLCQTLLPILPIPMVLTFIDLLSELLIVAVGWGFSGRFLVGFRR